MLVTTIKTGMLFLSLLFTLSLQAQTIRYVNASAVGNNDGSSWADAYTTIQPAINASTIGDQIWVAAGTYVPTNGVGGTSLPSNSYDQTFYINRDVQLLGGFAGTETSVNQRDPSNNITILEGNGKRHTVFIEDNSIGSPNITAGCIISGFTIQNGRATGSSFPDNVGAGILIRGIANSSNDIISPSINNCIFEGNLASGNGGAIYSYAHAAASSDPSIQYCTFRNNMADKGGAIYFSVFTGTPLLSDCNFESNNSNQLAGAVYYYMNTGVSGVLNRNISNCVFANNQSNQGAAFVAEAAMTGTFNINIIDCEFTGNTANLDAGAIFALGNSSNLTVNLGLMGNLFEQNEALAQDGGAIVSFGLLGSIVNTSSENDLFTNNRSGRYGGAILHFNNLELSNSKFLGNSADLGGAIFTYGAGANVNASLHAVNSLFAKDSASVKGGAIYLAGSSSGNCDAEIVNCTFADNESPLGGGIYANGKANGNCDLSIINSILYENQDEIFVDTANVTLSYSIIKDSLPLGVVNGGNVLFQDPLFVDILNEDYTLSPFSPAINSGLDSVNQSPTDLAGNMRVIGDTIDMGAYEASLFTSEINVRAQEARIELFPNPTSDIINVKVPVSLENKQLRIRLYNLNGQLIKESELTVQNGLVQLSVIDLPRGNYMLNMGGESILFHKK